MTLARNIGAGVLSSAWSALLAIAVVPWYIRHLGADAYGLLGVYSVLLNLLAVFDLGMAATLNREVARAMERGAPAEAASLQHSLATLTWAIGALLGAAVWLLSPAIAGRWLSSAALGTARIEGALVIMAFMLAVRWPLALYQGALLGSQRADLLAAVNAGFATASQLGGVCVLAFGQGTVEALLWYQGTVAAVQVLVTRHLSWKAFGPSVRRRFSAAAIRGVASFSLGMTAIAASGIVLMNLDRILVSRLLQLDQFGYYTLALAVSAALYVIVTPVHNALYPRLSALHAAGDAASASSTYLAATRATMSMIWPVSICLAIVSDDFVTLWTGSGAMAAQAGPVVSLLVLATALHCSMYMPYALQLAAGRLGIPLAMNGILIAIAVPLFIVMTRSLGTTGAAAAWLAVQVVYFAAGSLATHGRLMPAAVVRWAAGGVLAPLGIAIAVLGGFHLLAGTALSEAGPLPSVLGHAAAGACAILVSIATDGALRRAVRDRLHL